MDTQAKARELLAQDHHKATHQQDTLLERAREAEAHDGIDEKARELLTQARQEDAHLQETMHQRAEAEIRH